MGFKTFGFGGGRADIWEPEHDVDWGPETKWLGDARYSGDRELARPLGAVQMGLIYVNPEGPNGNPDPVAAARDIRETFARMAMNDEETVALIAGGHTFGKTHGAAPASHCGPEPEGGDIDDKGLGWTSSYGTGAGRHAITSGLEVTWTANPIQWDNNSSTTSSSTSGSSPRAPRAPTSGRPRTTAAPAPFPMPTTIEEARPQHAHHRPLPALRSHLRKNLAHFLAHPDKFADAFARAWFKLTHRDMGPRSRYLGPLVPKEELHLAGSRPAVDHELVNDKTSRRSRPRSSPPASPSPNSSPPPGPQPPPSAAATSAAAPTVRASASRRRRTGKSTSPPSWPRCSRNWNPSRRTSTPRNPAVSRFRWPTSSFSAAMQPLKPQPRKPATRQSPSPPDAPTPRRSKPISPPSPSSSPIADGFRNYVTKGMESCAVRAACSTRPTCSLSPLPR